MPTKRKLSRAQKWQKKKDVFAEISKWARRRMPFLGSAETKDTFFERIAEFLPPLDPRYKLIERAYAFAEDAHRGVERSDGTRYFEHVRAVALILIEYLRVKDYTLIVAALLHDVVEDNHEWTTERVLEEFGQNVALLVQYLTKSKLAETLGEEEKNRRYHTRFAFAPRDFFYIKLADRFHNLITLEHRRPEKRLNKLRETRRYYLPFAESHMLLYHELTYVIRKLEE